MTEFVSVAEGNTEESGEIKFVRLMDRQQNLLVEPNTVIAEGTFMGAKVMGPNESTVYLVKQEDGSTVGLNAWGSLKHKFIAGNLAGGELIRVTYLGQDTIAKGPRAGDKAHSFELAIAAGA